MRSYRTDAYNLESYEITANGFLNISGIVTRTGVFKYPDAKEFRPPEEVFNKDSLKSMFAVPVTWEHPPDLITSENISMYQKGFVASEPTIVDGDTNEGKVKLSSIIIQDKALIDEIINKKISQFSLGYTCDLLEQNGRFNGEDYDRIQKNIIYNHLAIVKDARCGDTCSIIKKDSKEMKVKKVSKKDCSCKETTLERKDTMEDIKEKIEEKEEMKEEVKKDEEVIPAWVEKLAAQHDKILEGISALMEMQKQEDKKAEKESEEEEVEDSDDDDDEDEVMIAKNDKGSRKDSIHKTISDFNFTQKRTDSTEKSFKTYDREEFLKSLLGGK